MSEQPIEVLIVDDSAVVRGLLVRALESDASIHVAGTAMHGEAALRFLRKTPVHVVVLDVEMPVLDGLSVLPMILREFPEVRVIMASAVTMDGAEETVRALAMGAAGCIAKPVASSVGASIEQLVKELVPLVRALAGQRPARNRPAEPRPVPEEAEPAAVEPRPRRKFRDESRPRVPHAIVIGTSTGGPRALSRLLTQIHPEVQQPIFIVQHMPPLFTPMLAAHLAKDTGRPCHEAVHNGLIERGRIYVAPGDYHLVIEKRGDRMATTLNQGPMQHFCRPSVNPLFESAADWYGSSTIAVMLTGMGEDGIEGARAVAARKGYILAQDEATSVVWGMPGAVVREGLADEVLPLDDIALTLNRVCRRELVCR